MSAGLMNTPVANSHLIWRQVAPTIMQSQHPTFHVPELVQRLYAIVRELETHFPGRPFTPDGHLVGSIGEVLAAHRYELELLPCSTQGHDARTVDGRLVQIKATQASSVAMRSCCEHLLALHLLPDGSTEEVYNGPGLLAWNAAGAMQKNGQRAISLSRLRRLMNDVRNIDRLPLAT
jgi:hypothetical protein